MSLITRRNQLRSSERSQSLSSSCTSHPRSHDGLLEDGGATPLHQGARWNCTLLLASHPAAGCPCKRVESKDGPSTRLPRRPVVRSGRLRSLARYDAGEPLPDRRRHHTRVRSRTPVALETQIEEPRRRWTSTSMPPSWGSANLDRVRHARPHRPEPTVPTRPSQPPNRYCRRHPAEPSTSRSRLAGKPDGQGTGPGRNHVRNYRAGSAYCQRGRRRHQPARLRRSPRG